MVLSVPERTRSDATGIAGEELPEALKRICPSVMGRFAAGGEGGAGFAGALERALELILESDLDACLAGGADSLLDGDAIERLGAFVAALAATMRDAGIPESIISFRVSTADGEQYDAGIDVSCHEILPNTPGATADLVYGIHYG